jgi:hypothetical protein
MFSFLQTFQPTFDDRWGNIWPASPRKETNISARRHISAYSSSANMKPRLSRCLAFLTGRLADFLSSGPPRSIIGEQTEPDILFFPEWLSSLTWALLTYNLKEIDLLWDWKVRTFFIHKRFIICARRVLLNNWSSFFLGPMLGSFIGFKAKYIK